MKAVSLLKKRKNIDLPPGSFVIFIANFFPTNKQQIISHQALIKRKKPPKQTKASE